jgi:hypothetical protein
MSPRLSIGGVYGTSTDCSTGLSLDGRDSDARVNPWPAANVFESWRMIRPASLSGSLAQTGAARFSSYTLVCGAALRF